MNELPVSLFCLLHTNTPPHKLFYTHEHIRASAIAAAGSMPTVEISPGVHMPLVGLGTWQYNDTIAYQAVCNAIDAGYTYIDTAWGYGNEKGVGKALKDCWFGKGKTREELFLMTKIPGGLNASEVASAHADNLAWLGLDYVDHLMTHFPCDWNETPDRCNKARRQEGWVALEKIFDAKEARTIGVSHYCKQHLDDVFEVAKVMPSINQVEWHVGGEPDGVKDYCAEKKVFFQSFSPLCGPCKYDPVDSLINGDLVTSIAKNYPGKEASQISLKFLVQQAQTQPFIAGVIPKSNNPDHLKANADLFDFTLTDLDMQTLLNTKKPAPLAGDCSASV